MKRRVQEASTSRHSLQESGTGDSITPSFLGNKKIDETKTIDKTAGIRQKHVMKGFYGVLIRMRKLKVDPVTCRKAIANEDTIDHDVFHPICGLAVLIANL
jgi:hypothetical protein